MLFPNEALNLFSLKAFKGDQPQEGYLDLSKEVVDYTGGLPLALEVLGSYLYGRNVDIWNSAIKKIKSVPHPKIQDKLKISYESLDSLEKDKAFSKTSQLKFLSLCEMQLPLGLSCLPCSLKVLHWRGCPLKTPPLTTQLDEVVDIKLSHSKVEQLWKGIKFMEKLKYLNMAFSKNLKRLPDFSGVPNLEKLILKGCESLTEVHPSVVRHKKVVLVNLQDCNSLKSLPGKLEMSSLKKLILSGCCEFRYLPEFGRKMENISILASEGTAIRKLPSSLGCLVGLAHLNLKDCKTLVCLPDTIHGLNSLIILEISGCSKLYRLLDGLKELKSLEELHANDTAIDELPSSIFFLDSLKILSFVGFKGPLTKSTNSFLPFNWMFGS